MKKHFLVMTIVMMSSINLLIGTNSNPTMSRIYGDQYTPGIADTQQAGQIGYLVPTGVFGNNGSLSLESQVPNAQAVAIQILDNGIMAVLFNNGTNTYMVQYTAQGAVYTDFAVGTGNIVTLSGLANAALSMTVDEQGRFLISGADDASSLPWIARVTAAGVVDPNFNFTDGSRWGVSGEINQLVTQTSGYIIAIGYNGAHAMMARYNLNGAIDETFGNAGYIIFDGTTASGSKTLPLSTAPLQNAIISANNSIYIAYSDTTPSINVLRFTISGSIDTSWNSGNPVNLSSLNGSGMVISELRMVRDSIGDIVVAVPSGSPIVIKAASITSASGAAGTFANFVTSGGVFGSDGYALFNMIADSNGSVYFLGSDVSTHKMAVIRCTTAGILDTTFNNGTGVNFFSIGSPDGYADINAGALAPDGQIFVVGAQLDSISGTTPYISSLYNNPYAYQVAQFPASQEQGTVDISFGLTSKEVYPGVVSPYVGLYRNSLVQQAETVIELASGNILIGMNGYTNSNDYTSMMLVRLTPAGLLDTNFGTGGTLTFTNVTSGVDEYITDILEDGSGNIYLSGYSSQGALFRKYNSAGSLIWNADFIDAGLGFQGLGVGFEGITRALLFLGGPGNTGQINAYLVDSGDIDLTFNSTDTPGYIGIPNDFGLNLGTLHNGLVGQTGNIFIAYKNTSETQIDVTCLFNAALNEVWTKTDVFPTYPSISADDVRVSFDKDTNVIVAASYGANFIITVLNKDTGDIITPATAVAAGTSMQLQQVIGISNGAIVLVGYDAATDGAMVVVRTTSTGVKDQTFDSQGPVPGITSLKIGDQIADFYARVASGITVQSHSGNNQGNLILAGYEQMFSNSSIPMILRLFGMPGTTQVKNFPISANIPGEFDSSYGFGGIAQTYALGETTPAANQEVRSIRELVGTQIMTIITDNTTSISYTERLNSDGSIDTTYGIGYGSGLGIAITKLPGVESVNHMVFDAVGNMLVVGANATYGGYLKRILAINGAMNPQFGGANGLGGLADSVPYPIGTVYGLMTSVNACQQLTDGNIVVVGSNNGVGTIEIIGTTGNPLSSITTTTTTDAGTTTTITPFGTNGQYTQGVNATSVSVDSSNNMYVAIAYVDTDLVTKKAGILKLQYPSGTPDASFGTNGFVSSAIPVIDDYDSLRLVFDGQGNIIIAASFGGTSGQVAMNRFTPAGIQDPTFNSGHQCNISFPISTVVTVTGLSALQDGKTLVSGYLSDSNPSNVYDFIACVTSDGVIDESFGSGTVAGMVLFQAPDSNIAQAARRLIDLNVQTDGKILLCGGDVPVTPANEETPLTFRLYGYPNVQPVPQFTGYQIVLPNPLNQSFYPQGNPNLTPKGISATGVIPDLSQLGNITVDNSGFALISGITSTVSGGLFVVARYLRDGALDPNFGIDGIATSTTPIRDLTGGYIAVDTLDHIYVGGVSSTNQFIMARLTSTGAFDHDFGTEGVAVSTEIPNLVGGGFVAVDSHNLPVIGGYTSDGYLVATRFTTAGVPDDTFAGGLYASILVDSLTLGSLTFGGSIVIDEQNSVYLGGRTSLLNLVAVKFDEVGLSIPFTIASGVMIATTGAVTGLVDGGAIALDNKSNIVIAGLTSNQSFVVGRFLATGLLDPLFNAHGTVPGTAYSSPVNILNIFGNVAVDSTNNIVVGGTARAYDESRNMIVTRFNSIGNLDTVLSTIGMATTGPIPHLISGGVVATDEFDNIFIGGLTDLPGFVVAQMYSGEEIFITNTTDLQASDLKTFYNASHHSYFTNTIDAPFYAPTISNEAAARVVLANVTVDLDNFFYRYFNQKGWNPIWHAYRTISDLDKTRLALHIIYPELTLEIDTFFGLLTARINALKYRTLQSLL